jgi:hypothetical protein
VLFDSRLSFTAIRLAKKRDSDKVTSINTPAPVEILTPVGVESESWSSDDE